MSVKHDEVRLRGRTLVVPATEVLGQAVVVLGRWLRLAKIRDEELVEGTPVANPDAFVSQLRSTGIAADLFTFSEPLGSGSVSLPFASEWDNAAVIATADFNAWWESLPQETRKNTRRAAKRGVVVTRASLDDELARGIKGVYDESPLRQGRPFWHYGKDLERVKLENGTYLDRSEFIAAYHDGELIGFMKWVYVGNVARIMQVLALNAHSDKRPMNALFTKAVEICHERGMRYLVYSRFSYGNKPDGPLEEFKRRLGFEQLNFRRYYVPLTLRGKIALQLGLHRGMIEVLPSWALGPLLRLRSFWFESIRNQSGDRPLRSGDVDGGAGSGSRGDRKPEAQSPLRETAP